MKSNPHLKLTWKLGFSLRLPLHREGLAKAAGRLLLTASLLLAAGVALPLALVSFAW